MRKHFETITKGSKNEGPMFITGMIKVPKSKRSKARNSKGKAVQYVAGWSPKGGK